MLYPESGQSTCSVPAEQNPVTVVFNDGRPQEQISNYALTRNTLYVLDRGWQEVPIIKIDFASTQKANRDIGVDFGVPVDNPDQ